VQILSIVGSRSQLLASTRVSFALRDLGLDEILVHAGFEDPELQLPSTAYRLETGSGTAGEETGRLLPAIEAALLDERPDCVVVFGDTTRRLRAPLRQGNSSSRSRMSRRAFAPSTGRRRRS
jgi:UDP-GlcNAc3NAcA epimerase